MSWIDMDPESHADFLEHCAQNREKAYKTSLEARLRDCAERFPGYSDFPEVGKLLTEAANHIYALETERCKNWPK